MDIAPTSLVVELAGTVEKIEAFVELMRPYGIRELAQTGVIAMARGVQPEKPAEPTGGGKRTRSVSAPAAQSLPPS